MHENAKGLKTITNHILSLQAACVIPLDLLANEANCPYRMGRVNSSEVSADFWKATRQGLYRRWQQRWYILERAAGRIHLTRVLRDGWSQNMLNWIYQLAQFLTWHDCCRNCTSNWTSLLTIPRAPLDLRIQERIEVPALRPLYYNTNLSHFKQSETLWWGFESGIWCLNYLGYCPFSIGSWSQRGIHACLLLYQPSSGMWMWSFRQFRAPNVIYEVKCLT